MILLLTIVVVSSAALCATFIAVRQGLQCRALQCVLQAVSDVAECQFYAKSGGLEVISDNLRQELMSGKTLVDIFTQDLIDSSRDCLHRLPGSMLLRKCIEGNKAWRAGLLLARVGRVNENSVLDMTVRTAMDNAPFMVWMRSEDLEIKYCNSAYKSYAAPSTMEISAHSIGIASKAMRSGKQVTQVLEVNLGSRTLSMEVTETPYSDHLVGYAIDITNRRYWESRCQDAERANYNFFESSSVAISIYSAKKRLTFYNNAFAKLWSLDPVWLDSGPHYEDILEKLRLTLPQQIHFSTFKEQQIAFFSAELKMPHDDFWHMSNGKAIHVVVMSYNKGGLLFAYTDNTKQLEIERAYNESVLVRKKTLENINEGVSVFAENGKLKLYNKQYADLWCLDQEFLSSDPNIKTIMCKIKHRFGETTEAWQKMRMDFTKCLNNREESVMRIELADNTVIDIRTVPLHDGCSLFTYTNVTDSIMLERSLRAINQTLAETEKRKSDLFANVSYELRSPLTSIAGYTSILETYSADNLSEAQRGYLRYIMSESRKLTLLIDDILTLTDIEGNVAACTNYDLSNVLDQAIATLGNVPADVCLADNMPEVYGNMERIRHVITKILSLSTDDSMDGERSGHRIEIRTTLEPESVALMFTHISTTQSMNMRYQEINLGIINRLANTEHSKLQVIIEDNQYKGAVLWLSTATTRAFAV